MRGHESGQVSKAVSREAVSLATFCFLVIDIKRCCKTTYSFLRQLLCQSEMPNLIIQPWRGYYRKRGCVRS